VPTFCRHNRLIQNCSICSREQAIEPRPVLTSSAPRTSQPRERATAPRSTRAGGASTQARGGVRVHRLARGADDGYRSLLVPGLKSSDDAERLAAELSFAAGRLERLETNPPGLYAEVGDPAGELEERTWLAFLIAYLGPQAGDDPFASIRQVRRPWPNALEVSLDGAAPGPRGAHEPGGGLRTVEAYRAWAQRAGSQAAAFTGEAGWSPERRFDRVFERLALPAMHRDARFDLLVTLGRLGVYELQAARLQLGGENAVTVGAKRVFGIGDTLLLERRAAELAARSGVPLEALDLALFNWSEHGLAGAAGRSTGGLEPDAEPDPGTLSRIREALGI
jgi:hypothetical protein